MRIFLSTFGLSLLATLLSFQGIGGKAGVGGKGGFAGGPPPQLSVLQTPASPNSSAANGSGSYVLTLTQPTTSGGLFVFSFGPGSSTPFTGVTETGASDTFSTVANLTGSTACFFSQFSNYACAFFYVCVESPGVTALTLTGGTAFDQMSAGAIEIKGVSASCIEGSAAQTGQAAGTFSKSATVSGNSAILGIFTANPSSSLTATSGTQWFANQNVAAAADVMTSYIINQTTTQNVTATSATGGGAGNVVIH